MSTERPTVKSKSSNRLSERFRGLFNFEFSTFFHRAQSDNPTKSVVIKGYPSRLHHDEVWSYGSRIMSPSGRALIKSLIQHQSDEARSRLVGEENLLRKASDGLSLSRLL